MELRYYTYGIAETNTRRECPHTASVGNRIYAIALATLLGNSRKIFSLRNTGLAKDPVILLMPGVVNVVLNYSLGPVFFSF